MPTTRSGSIRQAEAEALSQQTTEPKTRRTEPKTRSAEPRRSGRLMAQSSQPTVEMPPEPDELDFSPTTASFPTGPDTQPQNGPRRSARVAASSSTADGRDTQAQESALGTAAIGTRTRAKKRWTYVLDPHGRYNDQGQRLNPSTGEVITRTPRAAHDDISAQNDTITVRTSPMEGVESDNPGTLRQAQGASDQRQDVAASGTSGLGTAMSGMFIGNSGWSSVNPETQGTSSAAPDRSDRDPHRDDDAESIQSCEMTEEDELKIKELVHTSLLVDKRLEFYLKGSWILKQDFSRLPRTCGKYACQHSRSKVNKMNLQDTFKYMQSDAYREILTNKFTEGHSYCDEHIGTPDWSPAVFVEYRPCGTRFSVRNEQDHREDLPYSELVREEGENRILRCTTEVPVFEVKGQQGGLALNSAYTSRSQYDEEYPKKHSCSALHHIQYLKKSVLEKEKQRLRTEQRGLVEDVETSQGQGQAEAEDEGDDTEVETAS